MASLDVNRGAEHDGARDDERNDAGVANDANIAAVPPSSPVLVPTPIVAGSTPGR
jgi:hypothetical protein